VPVTPAPCPGRHGIPPSADRHVPPLQLDPPDQLATKPEKAPALRVELEYPERRKQTVKGFAMAWTLMLYTRSGSSSPGTLRHGCDRITTGAESSRSRIISAPEHQEAVHGHRLLEVS
jgi:hypothetical protein